MSLFSDPVTYSEQGYCIAGNFGWCKFSYKCPKAFRRNFCILIFVCACQMPRPLLLVYIFLMTSDNGRKLDGCHNVRRTCESLCAARVWTCRIALLVSTCRAHLLTSTRHTSCSLVIAAGLRDAGLRDAGLRDAGLGGADRVRWGLEGCPKAGSDGRTPSLHCGFHVLIGSPIQNWRRWNFEL